MDFLLQISRKGEGREERKKKKCSLGVEIRTATKSRFNIFWLRTFKRRTGSEDGEQQKRPALRKVPPMMSAGNFNQTEVDIFSHLTPRFSPRGSAAHKPEKTVPRFK